MQRLQETNMNKPNKPNQTNTNPTICMKLNIRSSCSICSPVSWDSHMVNVNYITPNPLHNTLLPGKMLQKNCQCFAKSTIHTTLFGLVQKPVALCNWDTFGNSCASRLNLGNLYRKSMGNVWMQMTQLGGAEAAATFLHGASRKPGVTPETKRHSFGNSS